tara:strand:+ start:3468 stop:3884 length:417 start_codon:yes stop_codon:yes gene_type:complete
MEIIRRNNGLFPSFFGNIENDFFGHDVEQFSKVAVNIKEREDDFVIEMAVPGIDKKDIHIEIEGNKMIVKGEVSNEIEDSSEKYTRREFSYGSFTRSFTLPKEVDVDKIEADYRDGVLNLSIPKPESKKKVVKKISLK